ncbi:hypothetical protein SARC_01806 [Sphaeroforma arctica JP610]|uniref:Disintegrin domain-containing protein n=1 Tax=Sphaeroforma arctica JP610 TaxID=667725 RepID=A0A0L0GCT8_9EUKA|nr:hypothetical protein SARC_01806 [Sphaeroforma arctica JP610]KNC86048.1 hypothetical protein SARC_01806 [Sphaeroforma arctica JP610]|eukprot:XP_014159950.1 hypothetical protein SARC_01806 [Sphaeroforma arctica JP610]
MKLNNSVLIALCAAMAICAHADTITCEEKASVTCEYYNNIQCCEYSGCDDMGTPKCTEDNCCRDKPMPDEYYCEVKGYDCEYKEKHLECCEDKKACDKDDMEKPVCSEDYCCADHEENEYDLTCESAADVDPRKRCNKNKHVIDDKECCRYTGRCSEGYEQSKCLHSFCCEKDDNEDENTCFDIWDCEYTDPEYKCGEDDDKCTLQACCKDTDPDGKYNEFCDIAPEVEKGSTKDSCPAGEVIDDEKRCCRYSNRCSHDWSQRKCLYSNCCMKGEAGDDDDDDDDSSFISCDQYYKDGAECNGEKKEGRCKERADSTESCLTVCCSGCPPITLQACKYGRVKDKNGCDTNECMDAPSDGCPPITLQACKYGRIQDKDGCDTSDCKGENDRTCAEEVECDEYKNKDCCRNTDSCSDGYAQNKCLESYCCA